MNIKMQHNYIDVEECASLEDIVPLIGKVVLSRKHNGKEFVTKLVGVEGEDLVYCTKGGHLVKNPRKSIAYIAEL